MDDETTFETSISREEFAAVLKGVLLFAKMSTAIRQEISDERFREIVQGLVDQGVITPADMLTDEESAMMMRLAGRLLQGMAFA